MVRYFFIISLVDKRQRPQVPATISHSTCCQPLSNGCQPLSTALNENDHSMCCQPLSTALKNPSVSTSAAVKGPTTPDLKKSPRLNRTATRKAAHHLPRDRQHLRYLRSTLRPAPSAVHRFSCPGNEFQNPGDRVTSLVHRLSLAAQHIHLIKKRLRPSTHHIPSLLHRVSLPTHRIQATEQPLPLAQSKVPCARKRCTGIADRL